MNPYVNTQSEPMGTDGQTDKRTNGRTDKYLLMYSGISSHSLRGVRIAPIRLPEDCDHWKYIHPRIIQTLHGENLLFPS